MLRDITLGQYFPGSSPFHRCDPRYKIIITLLYIVTVFTAQSIYAYAFMVLSTVVLILVSTIPFNMVFRGFRTLIFIIAFTAIINIFWTNGSNIVFEYGFIRIYREGIIYAVCMVVRLICLLCSTGVLLSYTTSPIALTDGLESLLSPLKKIKVPVHEFSMMMTIALRFIPTLISETDKIISAQKSRGADIAGKGLVQKAKALIPIMIPLFVSAFRRADELAVAMECRCYHGGEGRTKMNALKTKPIDIIILLVFVLMLALTIGLNML